jgi:hypothetical protein
MYRLRLELKVIEVACIARQRRLYDILVSRALLERPHAARASQAGPRLWRSVNCLSFFVPNIR